ncbi:MAG: hypothetical protein KDD47_23495, partial [Acidobacteria bacterium]|nr:hypothetical protein [Acidobacteriota bacterium]
MKLPLFSTVLAASLLMVAAAPGAAVDTGSQGPQVLAVDPQGTPTFVQGDLGTLEGSNRRLAAVNFLQGYVVRTLGAAGTEELIPTKVQRDDVGRLHVRVSQKIQGIPVVGAELIVHARRGNSQVYAVNGRFVPDKGLVTEPKLASAEALEISLAESGFEVLSLPSETDLVYVIGSDGHAHMAWRTLVEYVGDEGYALDWIFSSSETG